MVKFGRHNATLQTRLPSTFYLVHYNSLKELAIKNASLATSVKNLYDFEKTSLLDAATKKFVGEWMQANSSHRAWLSDETTMLLTNVIHALHDRNVDFRGATLSEALKQFVQTDSAVYSSPSAAAPLHTGSTVLRHLKNLALACSENVESLRKAVKKYDKLNPDANVGRTLLPELYFTSMSAGPNSLKEAIRAIEKQLSDSAVRLGDLPSIEENDQPGWTGGSRESVSDDTDEGESDAQTHARKVNELSFLRSVSKHLSSEKILNQLVVHRGFHSVTDRSSRPIENSLNSFETAWSNGISLCECDVALTVDGHIVLCHDKNFERLAMFAAEEDATTKPVNEMTLRELMGLQLRTGARPPLLSDVLESALRIGDHAKLVVEIKPGNSEMGGALCALFARRPELIAAVGVFMSFDLFIMHDFVRKFNEATPTLPENADRPKNMLLTVSKEEEDCMWLSVDEPLPKIEEWLVRETSSLDGVYVQFENSMVGGESERGSEKLKELVERAGSVGVWGHTKEAPDRYKTAKVLLDRGCAYVNTDLPRGYV
jgi:glycerophosphoryl diester phosphodiesterase